MDTRHSTRLALSLFLLLVLPFGTARSQEPDSASGAKETEEEREKAGRPQAVSPGAAFYQNLNVDLGKFFGTPSFNLRTTTEVIVVTRRVGAPPEELSWLLPDTFLELGLPVDTYDPETRFAGVFDFALTGRLGDTRLSRYLNCGSRITGSVADQAETVYLTVMTQVEPDEEEASGSIVSTNVTGVAVLSGSAGGIKCTTRGVLEEEIVNALMLAYAGSP